MSITLAGLTQVTGGKWYQLKQRSDVPLGCPHCGLVYNVDFRVRRGKIELRFRDNVAATAECRHELRVQQHEADQSPPTIQ
jgi:hypothetical protein